MIDYYKILNGKEKLMYEKFKDITEDTTIYLSTDLLIDRKENKGTKLGIFDMDFAYQGIKKYTRVFCPKCSGTSKIIKQAGLLEYRECTKHKHTFFAYDKKWSFK